MAHIKGGINCEDKEGVIKSFIDVEYQNKNKVLYYKNIKLKESRLQNSLVLSK